MTRVARQKSKSPATGGKIDLYKQFKSEYAAGSNPAFVEVGSASCIAVKGAGAPGGPEMEAAFNAIFGTAYTLKMQSKAAGRDYVVSKPEALFTLVSTDARGKPKEISYQLLMRVPQFITQQQVTAAVEQLIERKGPIPAPIKMITMNEGRCVQMMHVGPYGEVKRTIDALLQFAHENGYEPNGGHHEIYLSDPRRVTAEKLKTIVRRPVRKQA